MIIQLEISRCCMFVSSQIIPIRWKPKNIKKMTRITAISKSPKSPNSKIPNCSEVSSHWGARSLDLLESEACPVVPVHLTSASLKWFLSHKAYCAMKSVLRQQLYSLQDYKACNRRPRVVVFRISLESHIFSFTICFEGSSSDVIFKQSEAQGKSPCSVRS